MKTQIIRAGLVAVVLLAVVAAGGCGSKRVKVQGRLEKDGKPLEVGPDEQVFLVLSCPAGEGRRESCNAVVHRDGTFTVPGPEDNGLAPGQYEITLRVTPSIYAGTAKKAQAGEKFGNAFSAAGSTPLRCEVTASTREVVIDVGKKSATAR
jgi:hypothetical protein